MVDCPAANSATTPFKSDNGESKDQDMDSMVMMSTRSTQHKLADAKSQEANVCGRISQQVRIGRFLSLHA
jgi:hypothetical protein